MVERTRDFKIELCATLSGYKKAFFFQLPDEALEKEYVHLLILEITNCQLQQQIDE